MQNAAKKQEEKCQDFAHKKEKKRVHINEEMIQE
jgi:hypothetical protein